MKLALPLVLTLGLMACSAEPSQPAANEPEQAAPTPAPEVSDTPAPTPPADTADNTTTPTELKSIPTAFQGTWASTLKDCAPGMESRLTISANELQFLESHADITKVNVISPTHIQAFGTFEGEGEQWEGKPEFELVNGNKLSMTVDGTSTGAPRIKCP